VDAGTALGRARHRERGIFTSRARRTWESASTWTSAGWGVSAATSTPSSRRLWVRRSWEPCSRARKTLRSFVRGRRTAAAPRRDSRDTMREQQSGDGAAERNAAPTSRWAQVARLGRAAVRRTREPTATRRDCAAPISFSPVGVAARPTHKGQFERAGASTVTASRATASSAVNSAFAAGPRRAPSARPRERPGTW